jgi:signal transduction histidine kinase
MDFAFSNAHHVRGPVARMLGLAELLKLDTERDRQWYLENISNEVQQLDEIIKSISRELDEI